MIARPLTLCVFFIVFLATSRGQQCNSIVPARVNCSFPGPDHDVAFPSDGRGICIPSVAQRGAGINTLVLKFSYQPDCVEVSTNEVTLGSCFSDGWIVYVDTRGLFSSETGPGDFDIIVDGQNTTIEYGPNGTHSILPDTRTVSPLEPFQLVQWRSYFSSAPPTEKRLCIVSDDSLKDHPDFIEYEYVEKVDELSCVTDMALTNGDLVLEHKIMKKDGVIANPGTYHLVIANSRTSCDSASRESSIFTLTVEGPVPTPSPSPTPLPPSDEPPRGGGINVAAIAGGVMGGLIIILVVVFSVIIFIVVYLKIRESRKRRAKPEDPAPDQTELSQLPPPEDEKPPSDDKKPPKQSTVVVLDIASNGRTLGSYLASKEGSQFEKFSKPGTEEDRGWYSRRANSILNTKDYRRLYIIYRGSPEELRESYPLVWGLRNEIKTRPYGYDVLQKVVFVQVVSSDKYKAGEDVTLVEGLHGTFIIAENKLDDAKELARLIYNKVTLRHSHSKVSNMTRLTEPSEDTDDVMHEHTSPESSPGPHTRVWGEQRPEDPFLSLPAYPTSDPPSYPSQQAPLSLSQAGNVPIPQTAEEPMQTRDSQNPLTEAIMTLNITTEKVLGVLQEHGKTHEKIAEYTKQTAQHTAGMGETMEEIRQSANEASDNLTRENVSEDQQDVS